MPHRARPGARLELTSILIEFLDEQCLILCFNLALCVLLCACIRARVRGQVLEFLSDDQLPAPTERATFDAVLAWSAFTPPTL